MEPRFLGVKVILVKSFARIHETNLKKQGMLGLTFSNKDDYNKILEDDIFDFTDLTAMAPGRPLTIVLNHKDGTKETIKANHTYNANQIEWFKAGSALNAMQVVSIPPKKSSSAAKPKKKPAKKSKAKSVKKPAKKKSVKKKIVRKVAKKKKGRR